MRVLHQNKLIVKELKSLKSLTIRFNSDSEQDSEALRSLVDELNQPIFPLSELNLISNEKSMKILLNDHLIEFIKN